LLKSNSNKSSKFSKVSSPPNLLHGQTIAMTFTWKFAAATEATAVGEAQLLGHTPLHYITAPLLSSHLPRAALECFYHIATHNNNTATHCNNTATHCNNTATHCNNTATHCNNTAAHCRPPSPTSPASATRTTTRNQFQLLRHPPYHPLSFHLPPRTRPRRCK